ncbi:MAG: hemagglutinin repeat-containing protein [Legionellaceae bacterium]|nr:hemagglutinin repeat-containing protein [Legionellaceae bacterium]
MTIIVPTLAFNVKDIGLTPRHKTVISPLETTVLDKATFRYFVQPDEHGEYTFSLENLWYEKTQHHEFYDGNTKIFDTYYDQKTQQIVIHIVAKTQTNLFFNFNANECLIKSEAPLCIDGEFAIKSFLSITAPSLCLLNKISCEGQIKLHVEQGIGMFDEIQGKNLDVHASYLYQSGHVHCRDQYDISVQTYQQIKDGHTRTGSLRLVSEQCEITGKVQVEQMCFLVTNTLVIGTNDVNTQMEILGQHHLHCINGIILGNSQFILRDVFDESNNENEIQSHFICDQQFYIESSSVVETRSNQVDFNWLKNEGSLTVQESLFNANIVIQQGKLTLLDTDALINTHFSQDQNGHCTLIGSNFSSLSTAINDGEISLCQSTWQGQHAYLASGLLQVAEDSGIELNTSLITESESQFVVTNSRIKITDTTLSGSVKFENINLKANTFSVNQNKVSINNSTIHTQKRAYVSGDVEIKATTMIGEMVCLTGILNTDELLINAEKLELKSHQASMHQFISNSNQIILEGGDEQSQLMFTNSQLSAKMFTVHNHVNLNDSYLTGIDHKDMAHDIAGKLTLTRSRFITESQIHHLIKNKHLLLLENSAITAHIIYSEADISGKKSDISCERFIQQDASINIKSSQLKVTQDFSLSHSDVVIQDSDISANDVLLQDETQLRLNGNSVLIASQDVVTDLNTRLMSEQAQLHAQRFVVLGRVELCSTLLSAQELVIYDQFSSEKQTIIQVEERILLAKTAKAEFLESHLESKEFYTFGNITVSDSTLKVDEQIGLWSSSTTTLTGNTAVEAGNLALLGTLALKQTDSSKDKTTPTGMQLQVKNQLDILPGARITGDVDLIIEAEMINQSGTIDLSSKFFARGRQFNNFGSVRAKSIFLGFDDVVINHGILSSKDMTVHSNFMNILGQVYAEESLACSGFVSVNLGFIAANNYINDSFLSLNMGLITPNLLADPRYVFTLTNVISTAKTAALMWMPTYTMGIQLVSMIPGVFSTANNLYNLSTRLTFESLGNMRRHEYMPILCQAKNIFMFGQGLYNTSSSFGEELPIWSTGFSKFFNQNDVWRKEWWSTWSATDWKNMGIRSAGAFAGSYSDNSLLHVNAGGSFVYNTSKSSFMHINLGAEKSAFSHNINTHTLYNEGYSSGREAAFLATSIKNNGVLEGQEQFTLRADNMSNAESGHVRGRNANVDVHAFKQKGNLTIQQGHLKINEFKDDVGATTHLSDAVLTGEKLDQIGQLQLDNVYIKEDEYYHASATAKSVTNNVMVEAKDFTYSGKLDYQQGYTVKAETAVFTSGSVVQGAKTAEEALFVPKPVPADAEPPSPEDKDAKPKEPEKDFKPQHVLSILADKVTLSGHASGGDYTQIHGKTEITQEDGTKVMAACDEFVVSESADIDLKYGSIAAKKGHFLGGKESFDGFSVHLDANVIEKGTDLSLHNTSYQGGTLESHGDLHFDHTNMDLSQWQQLGELDANDSQFKVDAFQDGVDSHSSLSNVAVAGKTFDQVGSLKLDNVYIKEEEYYHASSSAQSSTTNVMIEAKDYKYAGKLDYEQSYTVKANTAAFTQGSVVQGAKTAEDALFVPKPAAASDAPPPADNADAPPKEPEKEFKPQHVLSILADRVTLGGKMSGGDYTQIHGQTETTKEDGTKETSACDSLIVEDSADIHLKYGSISAKEGHVLGGSESFDSFNIHIGKQVIDQGAAFELINTNYTGDALESSGSTRFDHSNINITHTNLTKTADEFLINSNLSSKVMIDESTMRYQGQSGVVTEDYQHTGHVQKVAQSEGSKEKNLFYVQTKTAVLDGSTDLDNGYYDIEHLGDGTQFAAGRGKYSLYMASESLSYVTKDSFHLSDSVARDCDLLVQASDISFSANYNNTQRDLTFISTVGDVTLTSHIQSKNLYAKSARDILMNNSINTSAAACFEAAGGFYNYGGLLNGDMVSVKAAEIKNITQGSNAAQGSRLAMGGSGMINARHNLFLESTKGNIENHGGILRGGDYAQLIAEGDVRNLCNERVYQGKYDVQKEFSGALISGGSGTAETEGIGLYVKAKGQVISDASDFISNGSNYIEGVKGVHFTARQHTYIAGEDTDDRWYGKKTHVVDTATNVRGSVVHSNNGRNIIQSGEGQITSVAARFSSPGGTDIYAKGDVKLYGLLAENHRYTFKSYLWGLTKKERDYVYQSSTPTLFVDNGATRIQSAEGNVDARGAYFIGGGDLSIKAKGRIQLGVAILNHEVNEKTRSFDWSAPGKNAWGAYSHGGNAWDIATAEDATLAKINSFGNSHNIAEFLTNAANLGIDLTNTSNSVMRGLGQDSLSNELMARYGLGGSSGFSPAFTLTLNESKTKTKFQTQAQGGIDRGGNVRLEAGEGVDLENGVRVHAGGNLEIDAPELIARAAALNTSVQQTKGSQSIGFTATGQFQSVGASYSHTSTTATQYVNVELSADGSMSMHYQDTAMNKVELDGANIDAQTLDASIDRLIIYDKQDTSSTKTEAYSVSSTGQFSIYKGKGSEKVTNNSSGIHVTEGINTGGHHVQVNETYMEGGKIVTEGENHFQTNKLVSITLADERHFEGVGISGNINDLGRLKDGKPANTAGEQTIATIAILADKVDYFALQKPVIYGEKATAFDINELQGEIHTSSADGKVVKKNEAHHIQLDVPITNTAYLKQSAENIEAGKVKLDELFHLEPSKKEEPVDFGRPEPLKPVNSAPEEEKDIDEPKKRPTKKDSTEDEPKKKKPHPKPELSAKEVEEIVNEGLKHLKFESPKKQHEFEKSLAQAQKEKSTTGKVSHKTEEKIKHQVTDALIKTLKAGAEEGLGKLAEKLGPEYSKKILSLLSNPETMSHVGVKTYLGTKGALFTFAFNLVLSSLDKDVKKSDKFKHGAAVTTVDISLGLVMKFTLAEAAGPIGWGLVILDIADSFYSQEKVDHLVGAGLTHIYEAKTKFDQGHYWDAFIAAEKATLQMEGTAALHFIHDIANVTKPLVDRVESLFDGKQAIKSPLMPNSQPSQMGFFKPDEKWPRESATKEHENKPRSASFG